MHLKNELNKKLFILFISSFLFGIQGFSQLTEQFDDGDFTNSPSWHGISSDFKIASARKALQSNLPKAGESFLSVPQSYSNVVEYNFLFYTPVLLDKSNYAKVYVISDNINLAGSVQGYYLKLGTGTSKKSIEFYRQDGNNSKLLSEGARNHVSESSTSLRIKIVRDLSGNWKCYSDTTGGTNFSPEFKVSDNTYSFSKYLGIKINTNDDKFNDKFFFDDLFVIRNKPDNTPPTLQGGAIRNDNEVVLQFDEFIDTALSKSPKKYFLKNGAQYPEEIILLDQNKALLRFKNPFLRGAVYQFVVSGIYDYAGNSNNLDSVNLEYEFPKGMGICINEIYADSIPSYGLPLAEYLEIYNYSNQDIQLKGFEIEDKVSNFKLPNYILKKDSFLVVCNLKSHSKFAGIPNTIGIPNFISLNNDNEVLTFKDSFGIIIEKIKYGLSSYKNSKKSGGGYSLERIFPADTCLGEDNFIASEDSLGGTPGFKNSVYLKNVDFTAPFITNSKFISDSSILINFSEKINIYALNNSNFSLSNHFVNAIKIDSLQKNNITIYFTNKAINNKRYILTCTGIMDCLGNIQTSLNRTITYILTSKLKKGDILFSEIMFRHTDGQSLPKYDYIEIYNSSLVAKGLLGSYLVSKNKYYPLPDIILDSGAYAIVCDKKYESTFSSYGNTIGLEKFPGIYTDIDSFVLISDSTKNAEIIDRMFFDAQLGYLTIAKKYGGFSLEKDNIFSDCLPSSIWRESFATIGGTPGTHNSVQNNKFVWKNYNNEKVRLLKIADSFIIIKIPEKLNLSNALINFIQSNDIAIQEVKFADLFQLKIKISFSALIQKGKSYQLMINNIPICGSLDYYSDTVNFSISDGLETQDISFNEILYKGKSAESGFIEFHNTTASKIINLNQVFLKGFTKDNDLIYSAKLTPDDYYLLPQDYLVLSRNIFGVANDFPSARFDGLQKSEYFPISSLLGGRLELLDSNNKLIDKFPLEIKWHSPFLVDIDGISLEKINESLPSNIKENWQSASLVSQYGTPTNKNGQSTKSVPKTHGNLFHLSNNTISPDGDGFEDYLLIEYQTPKPGYLLKIKLFSEAGNYLGDIESGGILNSAGQIKWEGVLNSSKLKAGNYVFLIEAKHPDDVVIQEKKVITLIYR